MSQPEMNLIESAPTLPILDMFAKIYHTMAQHETVLVYVSGGFRN